ncbi:coiled-coil domain-containing protein 112 [Clonorchis sinensis]|uniref:Coiled-coil domain-containing protein 112 n=1 Tax=Clonorchis sinensis TaxID=79923 RepID=G7YW15_CLOSI|nr:coiled-coil domain-containing protein 112 [Clonorchis sinensis]
MTWPPISDSSSVQDILRQIEDVIKGFRKDATYVAEALQHEETDLWQACLLSEKRIASWNEEDIAKVLESNTARTMYRSRSVPWLDVTKDLTPEVVEYEHFLESTGGRFGGWTDKEHAIFLKFFNRPATTSVRKSSDSINTEDKQPGFAVDPGDLENRHRFGDTTITPQIDNTSEDKQLSRALALHRKVALLIGTKSPEEILEHEAWWKRLRELEKSKRQAIQKWRTSKQTATASNKQDLPNDSAQPNTATPMTKAEMEAKRTAVEQWRQQQEQQRKQKKEAEIAEEIKNAAKQKQLIQQHQDESQKKLSEYQTAKDLQELQLARHLAVQAEEEHIIVRQRLNESADRILSRNQSLSNRQKARKESLKQTQSVPESKQTVDKQPGKATEACNSLERVSQMESKRLSGLAVVSLQSGIRNRGADTYLVFTE